MFPRVLVLLLAAFATGSAADRHFVLAWSDEFDGSLGSKPDSSKWTFDLGKTGWGNQELERYTNSSENAFLDGQGHLVIRALKTSSGYTSARLKSKGLYSVLYGKIEARMKIPYGQGIWPAFWMLGDDVGVAGWPKCGEIDIMENVGKEPATVHGTLHGPGYSGGKGISNKVDIAEGRLADDFHVYGVEWSPGRIAFLFDGKQYAEVITSMLPTGARWVFDHRHFLLLNLAVGGAWPGNPDATTVFPQELVFDWVRVSQEREQ